MVLSAAKPTVKTTKIGVYRKARYQTEKGWRARNIRSFNIFEKDNLLTFSIRQLAGSSFQNLGLFKLRAYQTKTGETRFIFYKFIGENFKTIRTASPLSLLSVLHTLSKVPSIPRSHQQRMLKAIRQFVHKYKVNTKYLSKNPICLLVQLCYPGTRNFTDDVLLKVSLGRYLKQDPTKLCLNTNGKYSRKLIYKTIEKYPQAVQFLLTVARYYRIHRSLDAAQKFLSEAVAIQPQRRRQALVDIFTRMYFEWDFYTPRQGQSYYSIQDAPASLFKFLDKIPVAGPGSLIELMLTYETFYIRDTFTMIQELNADRGFDISALEYSSVRELHDALVDIAPARNRKLNKKFCHYDFNPEKLPMQICHKLKESFNALSDSRYRLLVPTGTKELANQAEIMHNCSFYYKDDIRHETYIIFCIQEYIEQTSEWRTRYMFGYRIVQHWDMKDNKIKRLSLEYDQAVGKCNKPIEPGLHQYFVSRLDEIMLGHGWLTTNNVVRGRLPAGLELAAV